jgi:RHS repeat-associated protein
LTYDGNNTYPYDANNGFRAAKNQFIYDERLHLRRPPPTSRSRYETWPWIYDTTLTYTTPLAICATRKVSLYQFLFTGKERDSESGNDYFGARYYGSSMGRFMSPDWSAKEEPVPYAKLDDPQSLNLYSYVRNNPLARTDPDGHCCEEVQEWQIRLGGWPRSRL